jgi:hypothetical protein
MSRRKLTKGPRRGGKATKRLDPTALRELVADGRTWNTIGKVTDNDSDGSYSTRVYNDAGQLIDVAVEFVTVPGGRPVTARLSTLVGGSAARGVFVLPALGEEWVLLFPDGEVDSAIAGFAVGGGTLPAAAAQANSTNVIVCGSQVILTSAAGGSERKAARIDDTVSVTIPINTFLVAATGGVLNSVAVTVDGTITSGSDVVKLK